MRVIKLSCPGGVQVHSSNPNYHPGNQCSALIVLMNEILQRGVGLQPSGITAFSHKTQWSRRRRRWRRSEGDSGENETRECEGAGKSHGQKEFSRNDARRGRRRLNTGRKEMIETNWKMTGTALRETSKPFRLRMFKRGLIVSG